ncbi:hypothetical protein J4Q44_G00356970 [Coregonus suidteri]|uniref:Uncharacterized protein n=1 Tax=Coregonus suidteri TaxID=861788 RepID=A0AAN8KQZ7_9TELE
MAPIADERISDNNVKSTVTSEREDTTFAEPVIPEKARVKQQTQLPEGKGEPKTECVISESKQARSAPETTKKDPPKNEKPVRNENYSQEIPPSYGRDQSRMETLLHDTSAVKDGRSAEVKPAKNKQLAETQPLLFKHGITARNPNDYANNNPPTNETIGKADLAPVEMAKSSVVQGGKDVSIEDGQVENLHIESITIRVVSLISEIDNDKTTKHVSSGAEKPTGDNNLHTDSIAIRVVSGVSENNNVETTAKEREHNPALPTSEKVYCKPEVKPREKVLPTVPTAIADYARLKVISTEEDSSPNMHSPSRKDGYFPMIQTCRSRCPVLTTEQQDHPVTGGMSRKEAVAVKEPEVPSKLNMEAKIGVLSSMEQEQRKKGMFKLREKDKQAISFNEAKSTEGFTETTDTHSLKHDTVPQPEHTTTSGYQPGYQSEIDRNQRLYQSQNPPLPAHSIPSQVDVKTRNPSFSQQPIQPTHVDMPGKYLFFPTEEATQYMEKTHATQASLGDIYSVEKREEERRERQREEHRKEEERKTKQREEQKQRQEDRKTRQREEERMARKKEEREEEERTEQQRQREEEENKEEERKVRWRDEERMAIARQKEEEGKEEERREQQRRREEKKSEEMRKRQREEERMARQKKEERKEKERRERQSEEEKKEEERRVVQREEERKEKERREQQRQREEEKKEEERRVVQREEERKEKERREQQRQREEEKKEEERRVVQREEERKEKERREQQRQREEEKKEEERRVVQREEERKEKERREQQRQREEEKKEEERRVIQREEERKREGEERATATERGGEERGGEEGDTERGGEKRGGEERATATERGGEERGGEEGETDRGGEERGGEEGGTERGGEKREGEERATATEGRGEEGETDRGGEERGGEEGETERRGEASKTERGESERGREERATEKGGGEEGKTERRGEDGETERGGEERGTATQRGGGEEEETERRGEDGETERGGEERGTATDRGGREEGDTERRGEEREGEERATATKR